MERTSTKTWGTRRERRLLRMSAHGVVITRSTASETDTPTRATKSTAPPAPGAVGAGCWRCGALRGAGRRVGLARGAPRDDDAVGGHPQEPALPAGTPGLRALSLI